MENSYLLMRERHQAEVNSFPIMFAFNDEQFGKGMRSLGLLPTDTDKIYALGDTGGYYRKSDVARLHEMFDRHAKEMEDAIAVDPTGDGFIYEMFYYELANHEYGYTRDVSDTLDALDLTEEMVSSDPRLQHGLYKACKEQENEKRR